MSLFSVSFVMVYIIRKILALLKNYPNYLKDDILKCILRSIIDFLNKLIFP